MYQTPPQKHHNPAASHQAQQGIPLGFEDQLPSNKQLLRSTFLAAIMALLLLVTIVLPSEYAIDPTGIGRILGLTEMGEIKEQLANEAKADQQPPNQQGSNQAAQITDLLKQTAMINLRLIRLEKKVDAFRVQTSSQDATLPDSGLREMNAQSDQINQEMERLIASTANTDTQPKPSPTSRQASASLAGVTAPVWRDEISLSLTPGQGTEIKMVMTKGSIAQFEWTANGSVLNYDTHGDGNGKSISYKKGRGEPGEKSELVAAFTGNHGWFWRNRTKAPVTLTLKTRGNYRSIKRLK